LLERVTRDGSSGLATIATGSEYLQVSGGFVRIRAAESGDGWELYVSDRKVGYIRGSSVGFIGFASEDQAARAASIAHRALARRRSSGARSTPEEYLFGHTEDGQFVIAQSGVLARLLPPDSLTEGNNWGFEIALRPDESISVFAMARARLMWNAFRASGLARGMSQFAPAKAMSVPS
jgi:hypothetical protein